MCGRYYYCIHRWFHSNKLAFRLFHAKHHSHEGNLSISSAFYLDPAGGLLEGGIPGLIICLLSYNVLGNFWYHFASVYHILATTQLGHMAHNMTFTHPKELILHVINPLGVIYHLLPCKHFPLDHEQHHRDPRWVCDDHLTLAQYHTDLLNSCMCQACSCAAVISESRL